MKIKESTFVITILFMLVIGGQTTEAQIFDKLKNRVKETVENKAVNKTDEATEKGLDKVEDGVKGNKTSTSSENRNEDKQNTRIDVKGPDQESLLSYSNYDFVPGDRPIYYYDMIGEADSEIPGRMLINSGNAEIQTYKGEKVLVAPAQGEPYMMPYMKDNAYLPEQFTMEFDVLSNGLSNTDGSEITLYFREKENAGSGNATAPIRVTLSAVSGEAGQPHYGFEVHKNDNWYGTAFRYFPSQAVNSAQNNWRHVAIYINKNIGKLYMDEHRLAILNQIESGQINMVEIEVRNSENPVLFRNFRIAAGGTDSYNKVMTDGKFIAYGIQFEVNKATLRPESMGTINEFVKMMKENPDLKFEIGGHTDTDGTADRNNILSKERADTVKKQMVNMGIADNRLSAIGYGPSKPLEDNNSAEHKAKNRRVEFVKL
ncbi:MAG TPA: OmpA family protein [Arenibacter sp.]|nr:OmpA family protein [Arenibacter sp.]